MYCGLLVAPAAHTLTQPEYDPGANAEPSTQIPRVEGAVPEAGDFLIQAALLLVVQLRIPPPEFLMLT